MSEVDSRDADAVNGGSHAMAQGGLRVYTLGRFTIVNDGQPMRYGRKSPGKPLQLLKALIASGGSRVSMTSLAAILWPDKDGDLAQRTFETTLHRLRKYLGDDRYLLMEDGRLTLNSEQIWVDVWECERQMTRLRGLLSQQVDDAGVTEITTCANRIMSVYQEHFLSREQSTGWSVSMEERLKNRYIHAMLALGGFWEQQDLPAMAIACYRKGIEVDDLVETFYQRLMLCLDRVGRQPEAIASYRQCRHVLAVILGLEPTGETQKIYQSITSHYRLKAG
ncbi:MAG: hypothetical protein HKP57_00915 [Halobacteria archaeon]|nr:hypothetical protein [Halobacteria archaeon]